MKKRKIFKTISFAVLGLGVLGGIITVTSHFMKKDEVSIHPTFEVGGLDAIGKYREDKGSLYTKKAFASEGLKITLDFDSTIEYKVFYYDILDNFISSTTSLAEGYSGESPLNGAYARVEITPTNDEDGKISWSEKYKYSNQINIKVDRDAEEKTKKKYVSYRGNCYQVVNNFKDTVFEYGKAFTTDLHIENKNDDSSTTKTLLSVGDYNVITFDSTVLSEDTTNYHVYIYEFKELPTSDDVRFTINAINSSVNGKQTLHKGVKYILIMLWTNKSANLEEISPSLGNAFTLTKE